MTQNQMVLVVSVSVIQDNKILMINENLPRVGNKWNFPSGRIEHGEDILAAACREVKEETGLGVRLTSTTGIYNFISETNHQVILFHFTGEIVGGSLIIVENGIVDYKWIEAAGIIHIDHEELRNANVIKQIANRLVNQEMYSLTIFQEQLLI